MPRIIYITESQASRLFMINESSLMDYFEEYDCDYVLDQYLKNPQGTQSWGPLINPQSYAKALQEFTKTGQLLNFPEKEVYKWIGIIIRNTAILEADTVLSGHESWFPDEDVAHFVERYFGYGSIIESDEEKATVKVSPEIIRNICEKRQIEGDADDETSQEYITSMTKQFNDFFEHKGEYFSFDDGKWYYTGSWYDFLDVTGLYDWMMMPDGSDAMSDYGISPLVKILQEYNDSMTAEEVLVLVNRALDVTHMRGDLSSIFIEGGSKTLSQISGTF
jgi:hypothetical protein